ncbi:MAG TPA: hypothetical protein PLV81_15835 [Spirochaetota bacterium]|nr:hypothetical protein [Spirochaetota bacterium]
MKCEKAIEKYLSLDNNKSMPLSLMIHLFACKQCRKEIEDLRSIFTTLQNPPYAISLENKIMQQIMLQKSYYQKVSNFNWVAAGLIIVLSIGVISYSDTLQWLSLHFGNKILVPLYLVMGCIVSGYIGSYVATHLKKLEAIAHSIKSLL